MTDLTFAVVEREQLADALRGSRTMFNSGWGAQRTLPRLANRQVILIWSDQSPQPCGLVVTDGDREELFSWLATFHGDLTPLSSWCQVLSTNDIERRPLQDALVPSYFGLEAAWASAILAEAMNLSSRSYDTLSLSALFATEAFAIARTAGLYGARAAISTVTERLEKVRRQLRPTSEPRDPAGPLVRQVLLSLMPDGAGPISGSARILRDMCSQLANKALSEIGGFLDRSDLDELTLEVAALKPLADLEVMPAEERVRFLRHLRERMPSLSSPEWPLFAFGAGYVISRIGSAERDLRLADTFDGGRSAVLSWAMVAGSLGAKTYWTDAFGGLGRFTARELVRPLHLLDPPNCDVSFDEVRLFDDRAARVRLRSANRGAYAVSMLPGVTMYFGTGEAERPTTRVTETPRERSGVQGLISLSDDELDLLAARLAPFLRPLLQSTQKGTGKKPRSSSSLRLPFKE